MRVQSENIRELPLTAPGTTLARWREQLPLTTSGTTLARWREQYQGATLARWREQYPLTAPGTTLSEYPCIHISSSALLVIRICHASKWG